MLKFSVGSRLQLKKIKVKNFLRSVYFDLIFPILLKIHRQFEVEFKKTESTLSTLLKFYVIVDKIFESVNQSKAD